MDWEERAAIPCIGRERADLVLAGCAILEAICRLWPVGRLRVADRGVREGILLDLMRERRPARHRSAGSCERASRPIGRERSARAAAGRAGLSGRGLTESVRTAAAHGLLDPLAGAPAQRSLRRRGASAQAIARAPPSSCWSSTTASVS